ncbi:type II toxin-antitoxin system VapC family toxin [Novosphingobium sp. ERN07]|uniref:type II toxin-antitoxin system VapC family toxin n=1 Tax=Novosphingobium sp. ERN07 TaxID=2726187 RepID=UPI0014569202|nr:type II toxin-antitoxin system VapC family toxin [Novosphingobium sp. ERN07]NLR73069.1 type II toxin-antitoxin system VapC family toxin [Novosphingobium sp. ERN07]
MIVVDTSALLAIVLREVERRAFLERIDQEDAILSAGSMIEALMVCHGRGGAILTDEVRRLITQMGIRIVPVEPAEVVIAHEAFLKYGKGNGHPAQLNFGDLFAYALAKARDVPLLFKGNDFAETNIVSAITAT